MIQIDSVVLVLFDVTAAFDVVNQSNLLSRLEHAVGLLLAQF